MNVQVRLAIKYRTRTFKTAEKLKVCILIGFCTILVLTSAITYSIIHLQQPEGMQIKKTLLWLCALSLPAYVIVLFICDWLNSRKEQRKIEAMVSELTEDLRMNDSMINQPNHTYLPKEGHADTTDYLIRKIVQFINA